MSSKVRKVGKHSNAPVVRRDELRRELIRVHQKVANLQLALSQSFQANEQRFLNMVDFLEKQGVLKVSDFREYLEDQAAKIKYARSIRESEESTREEKIAEAEANDIPVDWVVPPEEPKEDPEVTHDPPAETEPKEKPEEPAKPIKLQSNSKRKPLSKPAPVKLTRKQKKT